MARRQQALSGEGLRGAPPSINGSANSYARLSNSDYDMYEEKDGITYASLKKSTRFMVIALVMLALSVGAVFMYITMYNSSLVSRERACWLYEQQIEALASKYMTSNGFSSLPAYVEDIPGYDSISQECPTGGSYTWNPITGEYTCSEHQHYPDGFNGAESSVTGTSTTTVATE